MPHKYEIKTEVMSDLMKKTPNISLLHNPEEKVNVQLTTYCIMFSASMKSYLMGLSEDMLT